MKKFVARIFILLLILSLFGTAQPVSADSGVIGTPPEPPAPSEPAPQYSGCDGNIVGVTNASYEQQVIDLVNQERTSRGLAPLVRSEGLTNAARYQAADMSQDNYFSHDTMDRQGSNLVKKCGPWERIAKYYSGANGENAAAGYSSPQAVVNAWMNSSGHRANILNSSTKTIGVGFYQGGGDYYYYWVQDFGTQVDPTPTPALGQIPERMAFIYSIPDQKLYPSQQSFTPTNVGNSDQLSWQVAQSGSFFSVTPGSGTTPTEIRVTPDSFNHSQTNTYRGSITVNVTYPSSCAGSPHSVEVELLVLNSQVHQVFLPGVFE